MENQLRNSTTVHDVATHQIRITKYVRGMTNWISFEIADGEHSSIAEIAMFSDKPDDILRAIIAGATAALEASK